MPGALPVGALLTGTYAVAGVLGQGGFGITYRCHDQMLERDVAVKEFFPSGCQRVGSDVRSARGMSDENYRAARAQFLAEARILARCHHVGIVGVHTAFEANSTAYMVMELLHGQTLAQLLSARGGRMDEAEAVEIVERVGAALGFVHDLDLLHRDIKPDNIIVCDDGRVMLIDFGTARETVLGQAQGQTVMVTPGYAPLEQYAKQARRGAFTDVYSLAATLYHLLSGQMPPAASDRAMGVQLRPLRELNPHISASVAHATQSALQMEIARRPQSVREFLDALRAPIENADADISPAILSADLRADLLHRDETEVDLLFSPPNVFFAPDDDDDENESDEDGDEIPAMLTPDALRLHQQLLANSPFSANPHPVKLAPPSEFSAAPKPVSAPTPPVAFSTPVYGGVQKANSSDAPMISLWWIIAGVCGIFILAGLLGNRNTERFAASSSQGTTSSSDVRLAVPNNSNSTSSDERAQKTADALRAWDALRVLDPTSIDPLPVSKNGGVPAVTFSSLGGGIEFSPDGKRLAYIDGQAVLRVLSLPNRQLVRSLKLDRSHPARDVMLSSNNEIIAVYQNQKEVNSQEKLPLYYNGISIGGGSRAEIWNLRTGKQIGVLNDKTVGYYFTPLSVANDGRLLLLKRVGRRTEDSDLISWNPKTGKTTNVPANSSSTPATYGAISPNKKTLVVGDSAGRLRWLDSKTSKQIAQVTSTLSVHDYFAEFGRKYQGYFADADAIPVLGINYSLDGERLASRNAGKISVFDSNAKEVGSLIIEESTGTPFSISPDGQWLAARGSLPYSPEGTLLYNLETKQKIRLQTPSGEMRDFGFSQDGKQLYGIFADGEKLQIATWNVDPKLAQTPRLFAPPKETSFDAIGALFDATTALSPSGERVAFATGSSIEVRERISGLIATLSATNVVETRFSPNNDSLVVRASNGEVRLWDVANGDLSSQLEKPDDKVRADSEVGDKNARLTAFSADNRLLAYARSKGESSVIELWSVQGKPRRLASLAASEPLKALIFSPDSKGLICGGEKGDLRWYDVATREIKSEAKTGEPIFDLAFAARNLVVMGESNSVVCQIPANSDDPFAQASQTKLPQSFNQSRDVFTPSAIAPDGKLLATAQGYGNVQVWELPSGRMLQTLPVEKGRAVPSVAALRFSADSTELTSLAQELTQQRMTIDTFRRPPAP